MKLTNYTSGYSPHFDCVLHGKITMTLREWKRARAYLYEHLDNRAGLARDEANGIETPRKTYLFNPRSTATALIAKRYKLPRWKPANYAVEILHA